MFVCQHLKGEHFSFQPVEKASTEREREAERERDRHSPFSQRHHTHVGMGYPLIPGQYDPFQGQHSHHIGAILFWPTVAMTVYQYLKIKILNSD